MKPFSLTAILLLSALTAPADVVMVSGTVYDVGKGSHSTDSGVTDTSDSNLCWAAAAANIIQHWQDAYGPAENAPNGYAETSYTMPSGTQYLEIFNLFRDNFTDDGGCLEMAANWYFNGEDPLEGLSFAEGNEPATLVEKAVPAGFYVGVGIGAHAVDLTQVSTLDALKEALDVPLDRTGYAVSMSVSHLDDDGGHEITCWGYETDADGALCALYITDSDDRLFGAQRVEVKLEGDDILLVTSNDNSYYREGEAVFKVCEVTYFTSGTADATVSNTSESLESLEDGTLRTAVDMSGQKFRSSTGLALGAGSILAASGGEGTSLTLDGEDAENEEPAAGNGLTVNPGAMMALGNAAVNVSGFADNGLTIGAEAHLLGGSISVHDNGGAGIAVMGEGTDSLRYLEIADNSEVGVSKNHLAGIYVEGAMSLARNTAVAIVSNEASGICVKGSAATSSGDGNGTIVSGLSTLSVDNNGSVSISGNKAGGISVLTGAEPQGDNTVRIYTGEALFTGNAEVIVRNNEAETGAGAYAGGVLTFSGNTDLTFHNNVASAKGGALAVCNRLTVSDTTGTVSITDNKAEQGSAIYSFVDVGNTWAHGTVSIDNNAAVVIRGNESSNAGVIFNQGDSMSISGNEQVDISGNEAGSGSVIHNAGKNVPAGANAYYPNLANPVLEIAHNGSVTFAGNTAQYDIYNENILYICADKGQSVTFQHGIANSSTGTTTIGKDASQNVSEGGTYIFADADKAVTLETTVATVSGGGSIIWNSDSENAWLAVNNAQMGNATFSLSGCGLLLSNVTIAESSTLTVDCGFYGETNTLKLDNSVDTLAFIIHLDSVAEASAYGSAELTAITVKLSDYITLGAEASVANIAFTLDGALADGRLLVVDTSDVSVSESNVTATAYTLDRNVDGTLYYSAKSAEYVPEPATATLSLLALAALAARRRRHRC